MTAGSNILIIDDDPVLRMIITEELVMEGFIVDEADNTRLAFGKLNQHDYDLALVDLHLPGGSGLEILKFISQSKVSCKAITMTGASRQDAVESMSFGAANFISKPFEMNELVAVIKTALHLDEAVLS